LCVLYCGGVWWVVVVVWVEFVEVFLWGGVGDVGSFCEFVEFCGDVGGDVVDYV
ncbi:hypothetical protein GUF79_06935, partial [Xanthomonas citri pv. citri]|nr:hypothetical protein [Xanthomonas citri pv. citri]